MLAAPFVGMLGKKYGPARVLPIMMFTFGSMTLLGAACTNFGGMMAGRSLKLEYWYTAVERGADSARNFRF